MLISQDSSHIAVAKKKAKHLHSMLKVFIPEIKLGACFNIYARLQGSRDWNTLSAALKNRLGEETTYEKKLCSFIDETLRPMLTQIADAHGMDVSAPSADFIARKGENENIKRSQLSMEVDVAFRPKGKRNTDFSLGIEISPMFISENRSEITFVFPEKAYGVATNILSSKRMPHELTPSLLRNTENGGLTYLLILEIEPFFYSAGEAKEIWCTTEKIEYVRHELEETTSKYVKLNAAFQRLSKQWSNKKLASSFETALWEVFTETPRFMSASPEFHSASFGDVTLSACMEKSGPCISGSRGDLNLGVSLIIRCEADDKKSAGYYIAKYGNSHEALIHLKGLVKEDVLKISSEFGIPLGFELAQEFGIPLEAVKDEYTAFFRSRAFLGLREWVSRNRSFAKKIRKHAPYLPDWYERAIGLRPIPDSDEELSKEGSVIRYPKLKE